VKGNYTFAKGFTNFIPGQSLAVDFRDNANLKLDKAISPLDSTHTLILNGLYELPLGRGKLFLAQAPGILQGILGGWQLNGIYNYVTGRPLSITTGGSSTGGRYNVSANIASTPNFTGAPFDMSHPLDDGSRITTLTAAQLAQFSNPGPGEAGGLPKNGPFRAPAFSNLDASLFKNFRIERGSRQLQAQFRMEVFNVLNQVSFKAPNVNFDGGSFGVVTSAYPARIGQLALKIIF
jgi:hypothetical protein